MTRKPAQELAEGDLIAWADSKNGLARVTYVDAAGPVVLTSVTYVDWKGRFTSEDLNWPINCAVLMGGD